MAEKWKFDLFNTRQEDILQVFEQIPSDPESVVNWWSDRKAIEALLLAYHNVIFDSSYLKNVEEGVTLSATFSDQDKRRRSENSSSILSANRHVSLNGHVLPSMLGTDDTLVGKAVTRIASASGGAGGFSGDGALGGGDTMDDFDLRDTSWSSATSAAAYPDAAGYSSDLVNSYMDLNRPDQPPGTLPAAAMPVNAATANNRLQQKTSFAHGLSGGLRRPSYGLGPSPLSTNSLSDESGSLYSRNSAHDFHKLHGIPSSSLLLVHYDPFYSPLLSRLDVVFQQLGYSTEPCRERLVCAMYKNPAKFAPFGNLVSAQLSR